MSVQLLDRTRKINKLLHNSSSSKVVFNDICQVLMETLSSNILVLSKKGKVLGVSLCPGVEEITELIEDKVGGYVDSLLNERFLGVLSTKENVNLQTLGFEHVSSSYQGIINPIDIAGERLGTVFMYRYEKPYDIEDIIVSEYGTTVVGLEMMRAVHEENAEEDRKQQVVKSAFNTLSFSELEAIIHIFDELDGDEGILVASKIADRVGITRSVIVNALRKFESAGVIESRSSGMKGTYIKVLNEVIFDELEEIKAQRNKKSRFASIFSISVDIYADTYPRSNCIPSTRSSSVCIVLDSSTVITPSLETFSIASATNCPTVSSLAEIDATFAICFLPLIVWLMFLIASTATSVAFFIPFLRMIGLAPAARFLIPS